MKKDGSFLVYYKDGWAQLTVFPPEGEGRPVYYEAVQGKLKLLEIPPVRKQAVYDVIDEAAGVPRPLVEWPDGRKLGPRVTVRVSDDRMTAFAAVRPEKPGGEPFSRELVMKAITEAGVVFGLEEDHISVLVNSRVFQNEISVARGRPPVNQEPARAEYCFVTDRGKPFRELDYRRIDLRELNFIQNCFTGDTLARLLDPVPPEDGRDVYGNIVPARLEEGTARFKAGRGTKLSPDGKSILADMDGNVRLAEGGVIVEPVITLEDVDYSNGNMDFLGTLDIRGRIADGFRIKAQGDIQIGKAVSKVYVNSGGNMVLKAGISGNDEGELICHGDLFTKYIENAQVTCFGTLYVEEAIMHSRLRVDGDVILGGKRAEIFGGKIIAGGSVKCKKLGSLNEPATELFLGMGLRDYDTQEKLETFLGGAAEELDKIDTQVRQLKSLAAKPGLAPEMAEKLLQAIAQQEERGDELNREITLANRELGEMRRGHFLRMDSKLQVEQWIFGNVSVHFGPLRWLSGPKGHSKLTLQVVNNKIFER